MLDTNVCIYIINKKPFAYIEKLELLEQRYPIAISSIVLAELQYGVSNSKFKEQNQINVNNLISKFEVMDFSAQCAFYYGEIKTDLQRKGIIIGNNDLLLASHAIAAGAVIITNNVSEFSRIKDLRFIEI
jgi:tRNA(fMet)-specific endonuclease VapC